MALIAICAAARGHDNAMQCNARPQDHVGLQGERTQQQPCKDPASSAVEAHDAAPLAADELQPATFHQPTSDSAEQGLSGLAHGDLCLAIEDQSVSHQDSFSAAAAEPHQAPEDLEECPECIVCWEASASIVLQPCGHLCVCLGCVELLRGDLCPMCRGQVLSRVTTEAL